MTRKEGQRHNTGFVKVAVPCSGRHICGEIRHYAKPQNVIGKFNDRQCKHKRRTINHDN